MNKMFTCVSLVHILKVIIKLNARRCIYSAPIAMAIAIALHDIPYLLCINFDIFIPSHILLK